MAQSPLLPISPEKISFLNPRTIWMASDGRLVLKVTVSSHHQAAYLKRLLPSKVQPLSTLPIPSQDWHNQLLTVPLLTLKSRTVAVHQLEMTSLWFFLPTSSNAMNPTLALPLSHGQLPAVHLHAQSVTTTPAINSIGGSKSIQPKCLDKTAFQYLATKNTVQTSASTCFSITLWTS